MESNTQMFSPSIYSAANAIQLSVLEALSGFFSKKDNQATVYSDYLLGSELDFGTKTADIFVLSPKYGVWLIDIFSNNTDRNNVLQESIDKLVIKGDLVYGNLLKRGGTELSKKHQLIFNCQSILFTPNVEEIIDSSIQLTKEADLLDIINTNFEESQILNDKQFAKITSILTFSEGLMKTNPRTVTNEKVTKGSIMNQIEAQINNFDTEQQNAAFSESVGPQRIRGLAGSGKTVILCLKVAALHAKYPDKKILYTFMTKSLYDFSEKLITRFYKLLADNGDIPDFTNKVFIRHSWGGRNNPGVYSETCRINGVLPLSFRDAQSINPLDPFDAACEDLLAKTDGKPNKNFDYVFIDEAQDFTPSFYQICRAISSDDNIIWAYDNLQNIYDINIQKPEETFKNQYGSGGIDLVSIKEQYPGVNNDIVLYKSYRNPKPILLAAQAIGFGTYAEKLVQTITNISHWEDLGYTVLEGTGEVGSSMLIEREDENSPLKLDYEQLNLKPLEINSFNNMDDEADFVAHSILKDVKEEHLRPEDIVVISIDDRYAKSYFKKIDLILSENGIQTYNLLADTYQKGFVKSDCVTLSTVYKAKGNEAASVYIVGVDAFEHKSSNIKMRNKMFVAMTRAKGWISISGIEIENGTLENEYKLLLDNNYKLKFVQQDVKKIQRDNTNADAKDKAIQVYHDALKQLQRFGLDSDSSEVNDFEK